MQYTDQNQVIEAFEGALSFRVIRHPQRVFAFEITFLLDHPRLVALGSQKPPLHFHPYQAEYVQVLEGRCVVETGGREHILGPGDPEFCIRAWEHHRLYPSRPQDTGGDSDRPKMARAVVSGQNAHRAFQLDWVFFENWYAYQDLIALGGQSPDIIQIMCMFDAGGSYLSLPDWLPLGRTISLITGIVIGRWLGSLLGYQPYYRQYTTDWQLACEKMEASCIYRRFADRAKLD